MKRMRVSNAIGLVLTGIFGLVGSGQTSNSDGTHDPSIVYDRCAGMYGWGACVAFSRKPGVKVYAKPNFNAAVLLHKEHGDWMGMLKPSSELDKAEWIPIYTAIDGPKGPFTRVITAYVPRFQVVLQSDFRRVVRCWPLKRVVIPYSDREKETMDYYTEQVYFDINGLACNSIDQTVCEGELPGVQHTYYAGGVFFVPHEKSVVWGYIGSATLDYSTRTARYQGATLIPFREVEWFPPEDLKDCTKIPVTDDAQPPIIKQ